ncbi:MAG: adhesin transport system membrane fusion protein [Cellvibrionaceae bacterium]|jgi:adhesin transport system membrane fusion protein
MSNKPVSSEDLSFASSAAAAVLHQSPRGGQQLLWMIMAFVVGIIVWAAYAEIDEFTRGQGRVIPSRSVQLIQNLEGGIVAEVFVREGQLVKRGEPVIRLDSIGFSSSLSETKVNQAQLLAKATRLKAEAEGSDFPVAQLLTSLSKTTVDAEKNLYLARQRENKASSQIIVQQITQKKQELSELAAKALQLGRSYRLLKEELDLTQPLVAEGAVSQVELLRLKRQANDLRGELEAVKLSTPRIKSSLIELEQTLKAQESAFKSQAQSDYNDVNAELSRLQETTQAIIDQVDRRVVKSPVTGTIKQMFVKTLGGVVQPGMDLLEIVPSEDSLLIETKIRPADIAFMHPGQKAMVKFTAYDFSIHGGLQGEVVNISPDTILDEEGESFYLVQIETQESFLGAETGSLPIIPGMTVNVDVLTGKKTVLDYILKPILKTKQLALRER